MSDPWNRPVDLDGYRTLSAGQQDRLTRLADLRAARTRDAAVSRAALAWSAQHSARPDLLVDAFKEARRG